MSENPSEKVEVQEPEKEKNVLVVEPDDYRKTQKLKSIQEAKENYKDYIINEHKQFEAMKDTYSNPNEALEHKRTEALALYGSELLPLIEEGLRTGSVSEKDLKISVQTTVFDFEDLDIRKVVEKRGTTLRDNEVIPLPQIHQQKVYRQLERIERKLGLGLDLEENKGPANI